MRLLLVLAWRTTFPPDDLGKRSCCGLFFDRQHFDIKLVVIAIIEQVQNFALWLKVEASQRNLVGMARTIRPRAADLAAWVPGLAVEVERVQMIVVPTVRFLNRQVQIFQRLFGGDLDVALHAGHIAVCYP